MHVLLINGSPREKGCTYTALNEVAQTLQKEDIGTDIIHIGAEPIRGCTACVHCKQSGSGRCVYGNDIVNVILGKAETADGFIFGSPVYYAGANGAMISVMDRMFFAGNCFAHKPAGCVVSARRAGTTAALDQLNKYLPISGMPMAPSMYWNMVHGHTPEDVRQDEEGLQIMRVLGRNMAWLLRCIQAGKKAGIALPTLDEPRLRTNFIRD
ncbi:MAG: flavodoxin family protein [Clostridia bacterium]|nr:flavodoxin family protein [Clostridia bacterium]